MGWLSKIFGANEAAKKEEEKPDAITVENLSILLDSRYENAANPFLKSAKSKCAEIQSAVSGLQDSLKILDNARYADQVDPHLLATVVGRRKNFIQKMVDVAAKLKPPTDFTFDSVLDFHNSAVLAVEHANTTTVDDYRIVTELFKREASQVAGNFKKLENLLADFGMLIREKREILASIRQGKDKLQEMLHLVSLADAKKKSTEEFGLKIRNLDAEHAKISGDISSLESSEDWKIYNDMLKDKVELQNETSRVLGETAQNISVLIKPAKKLKNLIDNGFVVFPNKKFVENFLDDPVGEILRNDASVSDSLLKVLDENISNKKIDLKEKENKVLEPIRAMEKYGLFSKLKFDFEELSKKANELESRIQNSAIQDKRKKFEADLRSVERMTGECEADLSKEKGGVESLRILLEKKKSELEKQAESITGKKLLLEASSN